MPVPELVLVPVPELVLEPRLELTACGLDLPGWLDDV